jgi:hypothetical protein
MCTLGFSALVENPPLGAEVHRFGRANCSLVLIIITTIAALSGSAGPLENSI